MIRHDLLLPFAADSLMLLLGPTSRRCSLPELLTPSQIVHMHLLGSLGSSIANHTMVMNGWLLVMVMVLETNLLVKLHLVV